MDCTSWVACSNSICSNTTARPTTIKITDVPTIAVDRDGSAPPQEPADGRSEAMAASQASRIRNRKCWATPTTQAATIQAETITRILMVVAWTLRWSKEMRSA